MYEIDEAKCIEELKQFLKFPSISSDSSKRSSVADCAKWLCAHLKKSGMQKVILYQTNLHPIVYAEYISQPSFKTILFYGHYDVQPVDPVSKWKYPPFDPIIIDHHILGRGASDDKGQMFVHIKAIEYLIQNKKPFGINIKCLFEGEEEIGSPNLADFINKNKKMLRCDAAVLSDTKMLSVNIPAITYSLRGALNAEISLRGQSKDLHSGTFGGMILNPANVLCRMIDKISDTNGRIMIPGFRSDVLLVNKQERLFMKRSGPADTVLLADAGSNFFWGEPGYSNYEKTTIRPSVTVTTMLAGFTGEGSKNAIPSEALVKLNMRLVPNQDPKKIVPLLNAFVKENIPNGFKYTVKYSSLVKPVEVSKTNIYMQAAANAYAKVFNRQPVFLRSGGTIPVVSQFTYELNIPVILMGFALVGDNMHAPNEKFYLPSLFRGICTSISFMKNVSSIR